MVNEDGLNRSGNAIVFLRRLAQDAALVRRCALADLPGRLAIATEHGYDFTEADLRAAVRNWDYHGEWGQWLTAGCLDTVTPDDLPDVSQPYPLSDEQIAAFRRDGHVLLRGVLNAAQVAAYRAVVRTVVERHNPENRAPSERDFKAFLLIVNLRVRSRLARHFALSPRFGRIAAELLGVPRVRVYLDEAFHKEPGGGKTQWHQDNLYFPMDTDQVVTMWLPLVDVSRDMGSLAFASGSHQAGDLGYQPISDDAERHFAEFIRERGFTLAPGNDMRAGDATFHHGWVLHSAQPNASDRTREVAAIVYYPDGARLRDPQNIYQQRALELGFRREPGALAASDIHPIVYDRDAGG